MTGTGLDIFTEDSEPPPDPVLRRGVGAILGLAAVIAVATVGIGAAAVGLVAGVVWLWSHPSEIDAFRLNDVRCRIAAEQVLVDATLGSAPGQKYPALVAGYEWDPAVRHDLSADGERPGDRVLFMAPVDRAEDIRHLVLVVAAGEPAFQQTFAVHVAVEGGTCAAELRPR